MGDLSAYERRVRVVVRDGRITMVRVCRDCGEEGECVEDKSSAFSVKQRRLDGSVQAWQVRCKRCDAAHQRANRARYAERANARRREQYAQRKDDPVFRERLRESRREAARRRWADPEKRAMMMERSRLYHQERKKREPGRVNEDNRMYYALRIERREGRSVRRLWSVIDGTAPRVLASPFRDWLLAYRETSELRGSDELALELGIEARRVRSVLSGESTRVTLDIVDRALTNARWSIHVWGRMVVTIDDLYELVA